MTQYAGYDVLELPADSSNAQDDEPERRFYLIDPATGKRTVDDPEAQSTGVSTYAWVCTTRAEIAELKAFLDARRGRAVPFWLPTFKHNATLVGPFTSAHNFVDVVAFGYSAHMWPDSGARRHFFLRPRGAGTPIYRKAISASCNLNGTESIFLDSVLGQNVDPASWMVGFLRLCRLEDDLTRIEHQKGGAGAAADRLARATLRIRELPKEAPL